jgi:hypothetical protein
MILKILLFYNLVYAQVAIIDDFSSPSAHGNKVLKVLQEEEFVNTIQLPEEDYINSLQKVLELKPQVLNLSFGHKEYNSEEFVLLSKISEQGTYIIVSSGNSNEKVGRFNTIYPCFYNISNLFCVGASEKKHKAFWSNYGPRVKIYSSGLFQGQNLTSFSAPRISRFFYQAHKCNLNPLEILHTKTTFIDTQSQFLIDYSILDFCYLPKANEPL